MRTVVSHGLERHRFLDLRLIFMTTVACKTGHFAAKTRHLARVLALSNCYNILQLCYWHAHMSTEPPANERFGIFEVNFKVIRFYHPADRRTGTYAPHDRLCGQSGA